MNRALTLLAVALAACHDAGPTRASSFVQLGQLGLEVPADWTEAKAAPAGQLSRTWVPSPANPRKESVTVIRSEVDAHLLRRGPGYLEQQLRTAQNTLPRARLSPPTPVTTEHGLSGLRLTVDYMPPGQRVAYHRVHVVLLDETGLVHVLYTARQADPQLEALELVLSTLRREEA